MGLAGAYLGVNGLIHALRTSQQAMQENARVANELKEAQRNLQFLSQGFGPEELKATANAARLKGGQDAVLDAQTAFADMKSQTASMSDADRIALFNQLVQTSLTTDAPMSELVSLFAKGSQYVADPERLQSIIRKTQELSPAASPKVFPPRLEA